MSPVCSAQLNGHDPHAYLKDVLTRVPTLKADKIGELLPHNWVSTIPCQAVPGFAGCLQYFYDQSTCDFRLPAASLWTASAKNAECLQQT